MSIFKVYISSTYRDLISYREKVRDTLDNVSHFKVVGMENYTAENIPPLQRCLEDVAACDIYVLIMGNRYGYVIPEEKKSVTHLEYLEALRTNKIILAFKCSDQSNLFERDSDAPGQPSVADKQAELARFKTEVGTYRLMHPEGFTSEYHLALQVMESLIKNPSVDFDGELDQDRKICCDRSRQLAEFYSVAGKKENFNAFLMHAQRKDLGKTLAERICRFELNFRPPVPLSCDEMALGAIYEKFKTLAIIDMAKKLWPMQADLPTDVPELLTELAGSKLNTFSIVSEIIDDVLWDEVYVFINQLCQEFRESARNFSDVRIFWFFVADAAGQQKMEAKVAAIHSAGTLSPIARKHIEEWLQKFVNSDEMVAMKLYDNYFTDLETETFTMMAAQESLYKFIEQFNTRKQRNDEKLMAYKLNIL